MSGSLSKQEIKLKQLEAQIAVYRILLRRSHSREDYFLQARLNVSVPGLERKVAQSIVDAAEQICTYSKAIRGNVDVTIKLV